MTESTIRDFWNENPCGQTLVAASPERYMEFFDTYDNYRYSTERHILSCLDNIDFEGKRVLEIGLGQGADSEQITRRGALWSGIDITPASVERVKARFALKGLSHQYLEVGSAVDLPFDDDTFDLVYSHGVLHHIPDIVTAQSEISRVLKSDGQLVAMLYSKYSLNYLVSISIVRRLALAAAYLSGTDLSGKPGVHLQQAKERGLLSYLKMSNFVHRNTDGPLNPYSKVYSLSEVKRDFQDFEIATAHKELMHAPPLPVEWIPLNSYLGWHLWVHLKNRK
jgi:ubiquinone/menaquinone biosynthesis C-methylase UbiE